MAASTDFRLVDNPVYLQLRTICRRLNNLFPTINTLHIFSCSFARNINLTGNTNLPTVWFCGDFAAIGGLSGLFLTRMGYRWIPPKSLSSDVYVLRQISRLANCDRQPFLNSRFTSSISTAVRPTTYRPGGESFASHDLAC
jgi:hypothetical protein